jgi:hypothetical protein
MVKMPSNKAVRWFCDSTPTDSIGQGCNVLVHSQEVAGQNEIDISQEMVERFMGTDPHPGHFLAVMAFLYHQPGMPLAH